MIKKMYQSKLKAAIMAYLVLNISIGNAAAFDPLTQIDVSKHPLEYWQEQAQKKDPLALAALGILYENGYKVSKNPQKAFELMKEAASRNNTQGQAILARYFEDGFGTKQDHREAFRWYQISAAGGNPVGEYGLASYYSDAKSQFGFKVDEEKQLALLERAASKGLVLAKLTLGIKYTNGIGVKADHKRGAQLMLEAADAGEHEAIFNLGVAYARGEGVSRNLAICVALHSYANQLGFSSSYDALKKILPYVPPPELDAGLFLAERMLKDKKVSPAIEAHQLYLKSKQKNN